MYSNPNAYQDPPVIPLGLEYITSTLRASGYDVSVLDLCFSEDPVGILKNWLENNSCALIGITVRNVDTVLYQNNEFFLDQIRDIVILIKEYSIPIVLGGLDFLFLLMKFYVIAERIMEFMVQVREHLFISPINYLVDLFSMRIK